MAGSNNSEATLLLVDKLAEDKREKQAERDRSESYGG